MKTRERGERRSRARRGSMPWRSLVAVLVGLSLCLALAACGSSPSQAASATPTATAASGGGGQIQTSPTATTPQQSGPTGPTATPFGNGTPSAALGSTDVCAATPTPSSASLPSDIPPYPSAQLTVGSTNGGSGVFGLCSSDSVSAINGFYASQLPTHGWQKITDTQPSDWSQITASQGNTSLIVTISADTSVQGKTQILIIYSGS